MRSLLYLVLPLITLADSSPSFCPSGTWVDQNGGCHYGSRPSGEPIGWVDHNGNRIYPHTWPGNNNHGPPPDNVYPYGTNTVTYTMPDGTRVILPADRRYVRANNPGVFFDAKWQDRRDIQPLRDNKAGIPYLKDVNWDLARKMRLVHGILSSIAFVLLFPLGAIVVNLGPGMFGVGGHVVTQVLGWLFSLVGAAAGLWIASVIRWQGFSFVSIPPPLVLSQEHDMSNKPSVLELSRNNRADSIHPPLHPTHPRHITSPLLPPKQPPRLLLHSTRLARPTHHTPWHYKRGPGPAHRRKRL